MKKNLDITKGQGTGNMCSLYEVLFHIYLTITGAKKLVRFTEDFVMYMQVRYIEVLFHIFDHHWGKETRSFYRGLRLVEVRYIEVPLYLTIYIAQCLRL